MNISLRLNHFYQSFLSSNLVRLIYFYRTLWHAVQTQQGGGLLKLQAMGERRFCDRLRVQYASLCSYEAVRDADGADHRHHRLHHCRIAAQAQAATAQSDRRRSEGRPDRGESAGGDRRREGRPRRRDHNHPPVSDLRHRRNRSSLKVLSALAALSRLVDEKVETTVAGKRQSIDFADILSSAISDEI